MSENENKKEPVIQEDETIFEKESASEASAPQMEPPDAPSPGPKDKKGRGGKILLIIGIILLLLLLIGGGMVLSVLRELRGDDPVEIVTRSEAYSMPEMEDTVVTIPWEDFVTMTDEVTETAPVIDTEKATDTVTDTEAVTNIPQKTPIYEQHKNDENVINILLLGRDARNPDVSWGRTDTMIILSYNKKTNDVKLVSLMRDMLIPIEGHDWNRINTAFAFGGIGLCINTLNDVFQLDIQDYVTIDFEGLIAVIDAIGGVDVTLTADEVALYKQRGLLPSDAQAGVFHLDGEMALAHARNRSLGSDFERTRRQRDILTAIFEKVTASLSLTEITNLITSTLKIVNTNIPAATLISLAGDVVSKKSEIEISNGRLPFNDTYRGVTYKKMAVLEIDIAENIRLLHELLYDYEID